MNSSPAVTIVTPTKNRRKLLGETMDSVRRQTFEDWEHIIVDDGSDDGTADEVARRSAGDSRIRYVVRPGEKVGANVCRNIGLHEARADLIVFLDSDDLLRPESLQRRVEVMRNNRDLDFAVFQAAVCQDAPDDLGLIYHTQMPGDDLLRFLSLECVWQTTGPIWRRTFLEEIGGFEENLLSMQDLEMHVRAICTGGKYIFFIGIDHDIRGHCDPTRTSTRHFGDPAYIEAAGLVGDLLFSSVKNAGLLTWSRQRAVLGLSFGLSECWLRLGRADRALKTWNEGCNRYAAPLNVRLAGHGMLHLLRFTRSKAGLISRLVNKWKGWTRFRQEPNLIAAADITVPQTSHLEQFER
jgi:glycosyltransferase involved in cell wall biosynthesis